MKSMKRKFLYSATLLLIVGCLSSRDEDNVREIAGSFGYEVLSQTESSVPTIGGAPCSVFYRWFRLTALRVVRPLDGMGCNDKVLVRLRVCYRNENDYVISETPLECWRPD